MHRKVPFDINKMPVSGPLAKFPIGFNPEEASVEELEKYCYPPCPDPTSAPNHYAIWAGFASRRPQFVSPDFIEQPLDTGLGRNRNWSGAVLSVRSEDNKKGGRFQEVTGSWVIAKARPIYNADCTLKDGAYRLWNWIGLDGWENQQSLKIGLTTELDVS